MGYKIFNVKRNKMKGRKILSNKFMYQAEYYGGKFMVYKWHIRGEPSKDLVYRKRADIDGSARSQVSLSYLHDQGYRDTEEEAIALVETAIALIKPDPNISKLNELIEQVKHMTVEEYDELYKSTENMENIHIIFPEDYFRAKVIIFLAKHMSRKSCIFLMGRKDCKEYGIYEAFGQKTPSEIIPICPGFPCGSEQCIQQRINMASEKI